MEDNFAPLPRGFLPAPFHARLSEDGDPSTHQMMPVVGRGLVSKAETK